MRIRIESPFPIQAGLFKPARVRTIGATGNTVHWYEINQRDLDTFLREIFYYYDSNYAQKMRGREEYCWFASLTLYYRSTTIALNLSQARLCHNPNYRVQFRQELSGDFGFYPDSIEFWEFDTASNVYTYHNIRTIMNRIITEFPK
jgi:hypothetical protein